jgi:oligosaccharide 4-alpha-D-glucosyltransferase
VGAFIPSVADMRNTKAYSSQSLRVDFYADFSVESAFYTMYEDDGKDPNSISNEQLQELSFSSIHKLIDGYEVLELVARVRGDYKGAPKRRSIIMAINGLKYTLKRFM